MDDAQAWLEPHGPAVIAGSLAQIDVFVVKKEIAVEATELVKTITPQQQTASGDPGDARASAAVHPAVLAASTGHRQAGERACQGGKRPR